MSKLFNLELLIEKLKKNSAISLTEKEPNEPYHSYSYNKETGMIRQIEIKDPPIYDHRKTIWDPSEVAEPEFLIGVNLESPSIIQGMIYFLHDGYTDFYPLLEDLPTRNLTGISISDEESILYQYSFLFDNAIYIPFKQVTFNGVLYETVLIKLFLSTGEYSIIDLGNDIQTTFDLSSIPSLIPFRFEVDLFRFYDSINDKTFSYNLEDSTYQIEATEKPSYVINNKEYNVTLDKDEITVSNLTDEITTTITVFEPPTLYYTNTGGYLKTENKVYDLSGELIFELPTFGSQINLLTDTITNTPRYGTKIGDFIYFINEEFESYEVWKFNLTTNTLSVIHHTDTDFEFTRWSKYIKTDTGHIYGIPSDHPHILHIDTNTDTVETFGDFGIDAEKWKNAVLANNAIYCIPANAYQVLKINMDNTFELLGTEDTTLYKWINYEVLDNGKIYCIPSNAVSCLSIDPATDTCETFGSASTVNTGYVNWDKSIVVGTNIYCFPGQAENVLKIDTMAKTISSNGFTANEMSAVSTKCTQPYQYGDYIYAIPYEYNTILKYTISTDTLEEIGDFGSCKSRWIQTVESNNKLYGLPMYGSEIIEFDMTTETISGFGEVIVNDLTESTLKWTKWIQENETTYIGIPGTDDRIIKVNIDTQTVEPIIEGFTGFNGMIIEAETNAYIVNASHGLYEISFNSTSNSPTISWDIFECNNNFYVLYYDTNNIEILNINDLTTESYDTIILIESFVSDSFLFFSRKNLLYITGKTDSGDIETYQYNFLDSTLETINHFNYPDFSPALFGDSKKIIIT